MKPHPRIRKTNKWGGAAVTVLLVVAWIGSGWRMVRVYAGRNQYQLLAGAVSVERASPFASNAPAAWYICRVATPQAPTWRFSKSDVITTYTGLASASTVYSTAWVVPLWPFVLSAAVVTFVAWGWDRVLRRRARLNLCPKCNYDRAGLGAQVVCPECGSAAGSV